jgi:hypothetical protein
VKKMSLLADPKLRNEEEEHPCRSKFHNKEDEHLGCSTEGLMTKTLQHEIA